MEGRKTPEYVKLDPARRTKKTIFCTALVLPDVEKRQKERAKKAQKEWQEQRILNRATEEK